MKFLAQSISFIFHPLFIPIYLVLLLFSLPVIPVLRLTPIFEYVLIGLITINNILLPIASFYMLKRQGRIESLHMKTANERQMPYIFILFFYIITAFMLWRTNYLDPIILFIPMAAALTVLSIIPLNRYLKISAHLASAGSTIAYLFILHFYLNYNLLIPITIAIFIAGTMGSSRLYLKAHTNKEVYFGFFVGFSITLLVGSLYLF